MNKRISVWVVETYFKDTDTPGQSAWSTKKLALEAAEFYLKSCSGVEKQLDHANLKSWRTDQGQVFVNELMVLDTYGFSPSSCKGEPETNPKLVRQSTYLTG